MYISDDNGNLKVWNKAQIVVGKSRNKIRNTWYTIISLVKHMQQNNQFYDYMENILVLVSENGQSPKRE